MEIDIYTDCGGSNAYVGIGIHTIDSNELEKSYMLRTHINHINSFYNIETSMTLGEVHAILTSLSLVDSKVKKVRIYTDSEHSFFICNKIYTTKDISKIEVYEKLNLIFDSYKDKFEIELMWIKGHVGVYGNEISDLISQRALKRSVKENEIFEVSIPKKGKPIRYVTSKSI